MRTVEKFLTDLTINGNVAKSTLNQAMNVLAFLYKYVMSEPFEKRIDTIRSSKTFRIPVLMNQKEVTLENIF